MSDAKTATTPTTTTRESPTLDEMLEESALKAYIDAVEEYVETLEQVRSGNHLFRSKDAMNEKLAELKADMNHYKERAWSAYVAALHIVARKAGGETRKAGAGVGDAAGC